MNRKLSLLAFSLLTGIVVVLVILFILASLTILSVSAQPTTDSISGYVFKADGTTIITDVLISVHAHGVSAGSSSFGTYASQTDASYTISGLTPGTYRVQDNNNLEPGYITEYYDNKVALNQADSVVVVAGQNTSGIDFTLGEDGSITGSVYEEDGTTPVENACVNVTLTAPNWNQALGWCCTNQNGEYTINSLAAGSYYLKTHASCQGANSSLQDEWYATSGSTPDGNQATSVTVVTNQTISGTNFNLDVGGGISGHVFEQDGTTPVTNACVNVSSTAPDWNQIAGFCCTDTNGSFTISNVPLGTVYVRTHADCQSENPDLVDEWYAEGGSTPDGNLATPVQVITSQTTSGIDFTLEQGGSISGTVVEAATGNPIENAEVNIWDYDTDASYGWEHTDQNGTYSIGGLPTGNYRAQIWASGWTGVYYDGVLGWDDATPIAVTAGQETRGIDFALEPGGGFSGYVYDTSGNPLNDIHITFIYQDGMTWRSCTDNDGYYRSDSLAYGDWRVRAADSTSCGNPTNFVQQYYDGAYNESSATVLTINSSTPTISGVDFNLDVGGSISGTVFQADGITPIANTWVYAMDTDFDFVRGANAQTDGSYQINALLAGNYYVAVSAFGYGGVYYDNGYDDPHATLITVTAESNTPNIDFQLSPEATVSGYAYETDGTTPIDGVRVQVWPVHGGQIRSATTDISGGYTVGGLSTGDYVAKAVANDYFDEYYDNATSWGTAISISVTQPNDTSGIDFTLQQMGAITSGVIISDTTSTITATTDITTALSFPIGAVPQPVTVTIGLTTSQPISSGFRFLGHNFTIEATTATGTLVTTFLKPFTITIHYDDADVEGIDETSLKLYYWDSSAEQWEEIQTTVDIDTNTITAVLDHLTTFAVLGDESEKLKVYLPVILK